MNNVRSIPGLSRELIANLDSFHSLQCVVNTVTWELMPLALIVSRSPEL